MKTIWKMHTPAYLDVICSCTRRTADDRHAVLLSWTPSLLENARQLHRKQMIAYLGGCHWPIAEGFLFFRLLELVAAFTLGMCPFCAVIVILDFEDHHDRARIMRAVLEACNEIAELEEEEAFRHR